MSDKDKKTTKPKSTNILMITIRLMLIIIGFAVLLISHYAFVFFIIAILPSITAMAIDRRLNKSASSIICAFNLMGISPYIINLSKSTDINAMAQTLIIDVLVWVVIYGSCFVGCILILIIPEICAFVFKVKSEKKLKTIQDKLEELRDTWGEEVYKNAPSRAQKK